MSALAVAMMEKMLQETEQKLVEACEEIIALKRQLEDQTPIAKFWRQAAEHAVVGWNALEDKHELLLETLRALSTPEVAPPTWDNAQRVQETVDLGQGPLRVVEEEKPLVMPCGHLTSDHDYTYNMLAGAAERDGDTCAMGWPVGPKDKWP